jgi:hypothetical protein
MALVSTSLSINPKEFTILLFDKSFPHFLNFIHQKLIEIYFDYYQPDYHLRLHFDFSIHFLISNYSYMHREDPIIVSLAFNYFIISILSYNTFNRLNLMQFSVLKKILYIFKSPTHIADVETLI